MTEQEWLECSDPQKMLVFLWVKASDRKLRLFACGCARRHCRVFDSSAETNEFYRRIKPRVDALCDHILDFLEQAVDERLLIDSSKDFLDQLTAVQAPIGLLWDMNATMWGNVAYWANKFPQPPSSARLQSMMDNEELRRLHTENQFQSHRLRDIFGLRPFRPIAINPAWLAWNDGTIPKLAQGIYDERAFDRLPILADALEEAGCTDTDILAHCRQPGEHVRGCWVVDLILGKE
jgi:hypothetical protein